LQIVGGNRLAGKIEGSVGETGLGQPPQVQDDLEEVRDVMRRERLENTGRQDGQQGIEVVGDDDPACRARWGGLPVTRLFLDGGLWHWLLPSVNMQESERHHTEWAGRDANLAVIPSRPVGRHYRIDM